MTHVTTFTMRYLYFHDEISVINCSKDIFKARVCSFEDVDPNCKAGAFIWNIRAISAELSS